MVTVTIQCEDCGKEGGHLTHRGGSPIKKLMTELRGILEEDDWVYILHRDYCPECWKKEDG